jgi:archaellum component FlaC
MAELTAKDFYETMSKVEGRIFSKIDEVKKDVGDLSREVGEVKTVVENNATKIQTNSEDIEYLERRDKGIMALASGIGGAIGTVGTILVNALKGGG